MAPQFVPDTRNSPINSTAVAIDKEKNSQHALRWAIDHLSTSNQLILIHVKHKRHEGDSDSELNNFFAPYRVFCAKRGVQTKEVILEEPDIVKALVDYISRNLIRNIVVGGKRSPLRRKFKSSEVSNGLNKAVPDFCSVYVIRKGKIQSVRMAQRPIANTAAPPKVQPLGELPSQFTNDHVEDNGSRGHSTKQKMRNAIVPETTSSDGSSRGSNRHKPAPKSSSLESIDYSVRRMSSPGQDNTSEDLVSQRPHALGSIDISSRNSDYTDSSSSPKESTTPSAVNRELEAEMRRLKAELKKTMELYSAARKEALTAKKASELDQWKMEEACKMEEALARLAEEASRAIVEREKAKAEAALEAADASKRQAELEAQKRKEAEMQAIKEAEEKDRALKAWINNDVRYRKYTIEEIEEATDKFARGNKIGEGGYGPVFKGILDHTPVAIKVLRPDAAHGRKQFHQEVEILCTMRHPHLVLLLGACPEYGCLVYEYMSQGSLEDRLLQRGNTPPLSWRKRFKIAAEIATALSFLHQSKPEPLVHRDLKPANILLDRNYVSKISDVGLARLVPPSVANSVTQYHLTSAAGTFCYIDPEYQQSGRLTTKSDIYSLGIMLLQIITAKSPMGLSHHVESAIERGTFATILDPAVPDWPVEKALTFAKLSLKCAELRKKERPDLATVILPELERISDFAQDYELLHSRTSRSSHSRNQTRRASASTSRLPTVHVHPRISSPSQEPTTKSAELETENASVLKVNSH